MILDPVVHVFRGRLGDEWFVRVVSRNGETMLVSEGYTRKYSARRAAKRLASIFGGLEIKEVRQ